MNFFKRSAWNLAYKSVFYTVRDHADKLEAHFANGGNQNESAGAFGTAEQYAQKLSVELDKIREMASCGQISFEKNNEAIDYSEKAVAQYLERGGSFKPRYF